MKTIDLGLIEYKKALDFQTDLLQKRIVGVVPDTLIIAQHYPVLTLGRIHRDGDIRDRSFFEKNNIPIILSNRGGKVTYHAPGQLVLYPIIDLQAAGKKDVAAYIDFLEDITADALSQLGVPLDPNGERRGVWAGGKKIAFIGIGVKKWVTFHGVSVNINNDIEPFKQIHPCGELDIEVTSSREILGKELNMDIVKKTFMKCFCSMEEYAGKTS